MFHLSVNMELAQELNEGDLAMLKTQLGQLQMVGSFGYSRDCEMFIDIMKGFKILQNMAEYLVDKILKLENLENGNTREDAAASEKDDVFEDKIIQNEPSEAFSCEAEETKAQDNAVEVIVKTELIEMTENDLKECKTIFKCKTCPRTFVNLKSFNDHECFKRNEKIPCKLCGKNISRSNMSKHTKSHTATVLTCDICDQVFKNKMSFATHEHKIIPSRDCNICNKTFPKPSLLMYHNIKIHGDDCEKESFIRYCRFCHQDFPSSTAVRKHMVLEHADRAIHCDLCDNQFFSNKGLKLHKQDHTTESI